jgi:hypothetical protein
VQCPTKFQPLVQCDFNDAWATIGAATVDGEARWLAWINWLRYAQQCQIDPWMNYFHQALKHTYLIAFATQVCTGVFGQALQGVFGQALQVGFQSVEKALHHVVQTLLLARYDDPRCT